MSLTSVKMGWEHFIMSSAIQKSIRRGIPEDALHYANLYMDNKSPNYVIKRLIVMLAEDIGFANISLHYDLIDFLEREPYLSLDDKRDWINDLLVKFALSPKSREIDNCICSHGILGNTEDKEFFKLWDSKLVRFDEITFNRYIDKFNFVSKDPKKKIELKDRIDLFEFLEIDYKEIKDRKEKKELYEKYNKKLYMLLNEFAYGMPDKLQENYMKLFFELKERDGGAGGNQLYATFFYLFHKFKDVLIDEMIEIDAYKKNTCVYDYDIDSLDYTSDRVIPEYVFDKHTRAGGLAKRGLVHFFKEGGKLNNEKVIFNDYYKNTFHSPEGMKILEDKDRLKFG